MSFLLGQHQNLRGVLVGETFKEEITMKKLLLFPFILLGLLVLSACASATASEPAAAAVEPAPATAVVAKQGEGMMGMVRGRGMMLFGARRGNLRRPMRHLSWRWGHG